MMKKAASRVISGLSRLGRCPTGAGAIRRRRDLKLTPNEFGLLRVMMGRPHRVFSRSELINHVQGYKFDGYDRTVDTHIKNLHRKIAAVLPDREIISSVYGTGYKMNTDDT